MVPRFTRPARSLLLIPLFLILLACPWDPPKKPPVIIEKDPYLPPTTITNVLENLRLSYTNRNDDEYAKLLHPAFTFVFDPRDIGPDKPWQAETWGKGEELDSAKNMFGGQPNLHGRAVDSIELDFVVGQPVTSPVNGAWQMVILTAVDLALHTTEVHSGDQWLLETPGNYEAYLHLIRTEEEFEDTGDMIWKIAMWEDKPPI